MIARYAVAITLGAAATFVLLFIMQLLIETGRGALTESRDFRIADFVRVERNEVIETRSAKPEKPPEPEVPPELPSPENMTGFDNAMAVSVTVPSIDRNLSVGDIGFNVSNSEYLPIVKVAPIYPARALARGLEGYVILEFTVTRAGTTRDIVVLESTNTLFDRPAVEAASKFKYKPRVIDGEPVEVIGVRHRITFVIEEPPTQ